MNIDNVKVILNHVGNQQRPREEVKKIKDFLSLAKESFVTLNDQRAAKEVWCLEKTLDVQENYLEAFGLLKKGKYYDAWCLLEKCEIDLESLSLHFLVNFDEYGLTFIHKKIKGYQSLFPYKLFISPEFLFKEMECTICGSKVSIRKPCGHEIGEIYDGRMCGRKITDLDILGTAFVENPVQKYSVPFASDSKTGKFVDHYNYALVKSLVDKLNVPFDDWNLRWTKKLHPHSKFKDVGRNDKCPCGAGKKYKFCCLPKEGVLMRHCIFRIPGMEGYEEGIF
jgi:hypothetical protein